MFPDKLFSVSSFLLVLLFRYSPYPLSSFAHLPPIFRCFLISRFFNTRAVYFLSLGLCDSLLHFFPGLALLIPPGLSYGGHFFWFDLFLDHSDVSVITSFFFLFHRPLSLLFHVGLFLASSHFNVLPGAARILFFSPPCSLSALSLVDLVPPFFFRSSLSILSLTSCSRFYFETVFDLFFESFLFPPSSSLAPLDSLFSAFFLCSPRTWISRRLGWDRESPVFETISFLFFFLSNSVVLNIRLSTWSVFFLHKLFALGLLCRPLLFLLRFLPYTLVSSFFPISFVPIFSWQISMGELTLWANALPFVSFYVVVYGFELPFFPPQWF